MRALTPLKTAASTAKLVGPSNSFVTLAIVSQDHLGVGLKEGMQLRDYFAAKVMAQIHKQWPQGHCDGWDGMAALAYSYADAMIRVREISLGGETND